MLVEFLRSLRKDQSLHVKVIRETYRRLGAGSEAHL